MPAITRLGSLFVLPFMLLALLATGTFGATGASATAAGATAKSGQHHTRTHHATRHHSKVRKAVGVALHQVGDPYNYGAAGPRSFDCSGLVFYSYRKAGFKHMPRTSSAQSHWLHKIKKRHIHRGDLMYFHNGGGVYHAAIFLKWKHGRAVMLDAPRPGHRVGRTVAWTNQWYARSLRH